MRDENFKYRDRPVIASINPLYSLSLLPPRRLTPMLYDLRIEDETLTYLLKAEMRRQD